MACLFYVNIWPTLAICFFSWSLLIWEPIEYIWDPLCLSRLSWRYPAFPLHTYFLSDLCNMHFPCWKIPKENDPPKHNITAIFLDVIPFINSSSKSMTSIFYAYYFFFSIFYNICLCLFLKASGEVKSKSLISPSNIYAYILVFI